MYGNAMTLPPRCPHRVTLALFAAYVVSLAAATANPAGLPHEQAYTLTQAANVTMLVLLAYCLRSAKLAGLAGALGAAFAARATDLWAGGTRWDSFLVTVGALLVTHHAFVAAAPAGLHHKTALSLALSCAVMPVLIAVPQLSRMPPAEPQMLRTAAALCREAYGITGDGITNAVSAARAADALTAPLWTLYDADTDTHAGVKRVPLPSGDTELYVYFAGSRSRRNWQTDFDVLGDAVPAGWGCGAPQTMRTHRGFTRAFDSVAPKVLQTLFKGPLTEILVEHGNTPVTYHLRDEEGQIRVDDVMLPAADYPQSLKATLEAVIPVANFALALESGDIKRVRTAVAEDFTRSVWRYLDEVPQFDPAPETYLKNSLSAISVRGNGAVVVLRNGRRGAQVTLRRENGRYKVEDMTLVAGAMPDERIALKRTIRTQLAEGRYTAAGEVEMLAGSEADDLGDFNE